MGRQLTALRLDIGFLVADPYGNGRELAGALFKLSGISSVTGSVGQFSGSPAMRNS
jgi:hypothetical protein